MAELTVHGVTYDLDKVKDMSEENYQGALSYVGQWDEPAQQQWRAQLQEARGEKVDAPVPTSEQATDTETYAADSWDDLTVEELKAELALHDLPVSGNKQELIDRLEEEGVDLPTP